MTRNTKLNAAWLLILFVSLFVPVARGASCKSQAQMTPAQRNAIENAARTIAAQVQSGNVQAIRDNTIPAVATNFGGIAATAANLKPLVQNATITVDDLYSLDASSDPPGAPRTVFYCGTRIVVLNFSNLPPGKYALAIVHATGVSKPQQISLVLSETSTNRWMLAGFFTRPMTQNGHDGLWYWEQARDYAKKNQNWAAWLYYQAAANLLQPVPFLQSPNLDKLHREASGVRPVNLPGAQPMLMSADGASFRVTWVGTSTTFGALDLEANYAPDPTQLTQLRDPVAARKQAIGLMSALLAQHPDLRNAFHGIWVRAELGNSTVYALELPMGQIPGGTQQQAAMNANSAAQ